MLEIQYPDIRLGIAQRDGKTLAVGREATSAKARAFAHPTQYLPTAIHPEQVGISQPVFRAWFVDQHAAIRYRSHGVEDPAVLLHIVRNHSRIAGERAAV